MATLHPTHVPRTSRGSHPQTELAIRASEKIASIAARSAMKQAAAHHVPKFYRAVETRLKNVCNWLRSPQSSKAASQVADILVCLEYLCTFPKKPTRFQSPVQTRNFPHLERLGRGPGHEQLPGLKTLAEKSRWIQARKDVIKQLDALVDSQPADDEITRPAFSDFNEHLEMLYQALLKHKICLDEKSNDCERLVTRTALLFPEDNEQHQSLQINILFLAHIHSSLGTRFEERIWQDATVKVLPRSATIVSGAITPMSSGIRIGRIKGLKGSDFCGYISRGVMEELLLLEVRNEILLYQKISPRETRWILNNPGVPLAALVEDPDLAQSELRKLFLSSTLAKAAWQFYGSSWMGNHWTKDNICFVWTSNHGTPNLELDMNGPFLLSEIEEPGDDDRSLHHSHPQILALGIVLMEILLGLRIENHRRPGDMSNNRPVANTDFLVANRLCCREPHSGWTNREPLRQIVSHCVDVRESAGLEDDNQAREFLLHKVVNPLNDMFHEKAGVAQQVVLTGFGSNLASTAISSSRSSDIQPEPPLTGRKQTLIASNPTHSRLITSPTNSGVIQLSKTPQHRTHSATTSQSKSDTGNCAGNLNETSSGSNINPNSRKANRSTLNKSLVPPNPTDEGTHDGKLFSGPETVPNWTDPRSFTELNNIWKNMFEFKETTKYKAGDEIVKIAILDTGIDLKHEDFNFPRAEAISSDGQPIHADHEPLQKERMNIKNSKSFIGEADDLQDVDGHGTQVASIILRLAPRAEILVGRICQGNRQYGLTNQQKEAQQVSSDVANPKADVVAKAIEWAIEQMSFGFKKVTPDVKVVEQWLKKCKDNGILVFAAMANSAMYTKAAWPARASVDAIGIHSCTETGKLSSGFSPKRIKGNPNFMVIGEDIPAHWLTEKGGGFRLVKGTSFATPVAVAIAALILAFTRQIRGEEERKESAVKVDLGYLKENWGMMKIFEKISEKSDDKYFWINPMLLWKDFPGDGDEKTIEGSRKHGWKVIREALTK
ncbi:hypothetical protein F5Y03DRAFT_243836 [Xylaria venustula]|nr:hypothetical protein F5Y03DRAFT_243836 [Xylaria venustula]